MDAHINAGDYCARRGIDDLVYMRYHDVNKNKEARSGCPAFPAPLP